MALRPALAPAQATDSARDDAERLGAYLDDLGLEELEILHLETELARGDRAKGRGEALARKLADLYAARLLATTDPEAVADLQGRIDALVKDHPGANSAALQVMRLEGDYNRAEALAGKWIADPKDTPARDGASGILARIVPRLDRLRTDLTRELEQARARLDGLPEGIQVARQEEAINRLAEVAGRAAYFDAWARYYAGLMATDPAEARALAVRARDAFRALLGGTPEEDSKAVAEPEPPELDTRGLARAALGLALAEFAAGDPKAGQAWFDRLKAPNVDPEVRDWADYWRVWALLRAGRAEDARSHARGAVSGLTDAASPGRVALCLLLARQPAAKEKDRDRDLTMMGIRGLLAMRRFDLARSTLGDSDLSPEKGPSGLALRWIAAQDRFDRAEKSNAPADYEAALGGFTEALAAPDAAREPQLAARCRAGLAWCLYRLGRFNEAAEAFGRAAAALAGQKDPSAADAAWMEAVARQQLAARDPAATTAAIAAFESFRRDHPAHPSAAKVPYLVAKLKGGASALEALPPSDPAYPVACLDACRDRRARWLQSLGGGAPDPAAAESLRTAIRTYLDLPEGRREPAGTLECLLMAADLALRSQPPDPAEARARMAQAGRLASSLKPGDGLAGEYHHIRLRLAEATGDATAARDEARWLEQNQKGSAYTASALIALARSADAALKGADDAGRPAARKTAIAAYRRLAAALGDSPTALKADRNALVASSRLADHLLDSGDVAEAARILDAILEAYPRDASALRRAGLAHARTGEHARALECWRILAQGLPRGSDGWFEAKYHQLDALARDDPDAARAAFDQFRLLRPDLGPPPWRDSFRQLGRSLGREPSAGDASPAPTTRGR